MTGPGWTLREATPADIPALVGMRLTFLHAYQPMTPAEMAALGASTREFLARALDGGQFRAWVAVSAEGTPVATSSLAVFERPPTVQHSGREGYILNMYTTPAWRRRGLARALLRACVDAGREMRMSRLWLHTTADGRALYASEGFAPHADALELSLMR